MTYHQMLQVYKNATALEKVWLVNLFLFAIAVFTSKAGYSMLGVALVALSFTMPWRAVWITEKKVVALVAMYPIAMAVSLFSLGGIESVWAVFAHWPWVLLVLPTVVVYKIPRLQPFVIYGAVLGFVLAIANSAFKILVLHAAGRIDSFWDTARWGVLLASVMLALFVFSTDPRTQSRQRRIYTGIWIIAGAFMVFAGQRAPWLAVALVTLLLMLTSRRRFILGLVVALIVGAWLTLSPNFRQRAQSVGAVHTEGGMLTSSDMSNAARLNMWKVALDFYSEQPWFGTGYKNTELPLTAFLARQTEQYRHEHLVETFSLRDQHSSYLAMWVQMGVLFSVVFWVVVMYVLLAPIKVLRHVTTAPAGVVASYAVCFANLVIYFFYPAVMGFESLALFLCLTYLAVQRPGSASSAR